MTVMAEIWDIYDKNRKKTGRFHERGVPLADGDYHLVVHIWVRNRSGKFLLTRRCMDKEPFPGLWECTGGSALAGETSEEAALRETWEETGIDHHTSVRSCVLSYTRWDWHGDVWLFEADFPLSAVRLQEHETTDAMWADRSEVLAMLHDGRLCGYDYIEELMTVI